MKHAIIIPTLNPTDALVDLAGALVARGASHLIIVNDGSSEACAPVFARLGAFTQVKILTHETNRGKGEALKTAFRYCATRDFLGVVTADDDGQHTADDILRVSDKLSEGPNDLVLGVRLFETENTPFRSLLGNRTVSLLLRLLYGLRLGDSQTGLRGVPIAAVQWMADLAGAHYEFEIHMLIAALRRNMPITEVPIQLVYFNNNRASHYKTFSDTLRIAWLLFAALFTRDTGYGRLFYFSRSVLRLRARIHAPGFRGKLAVSGDRADGPVVYVARHRNLKGVLDVVLWFKRPLRIWVLDVFCDRERCYDQYAHYTLTERLRWPKILAYPAAYLFSRFVPRLMRSMRAIPVYRASKKHMKDTLERTVRTLRAGEAVVLFPDVAYTSESDGMNEMYTGFVNLDKPYFTQTRTHIRFVPLRIDPARRVIEAGPPSQLRDGEAFADGKKRVCAELHNYFS